MWISKRSGGKQALSMERKMDLVKTTKIKKFLGSGGIYPDLVIYGPPKLMEKISKLWKMHKRGRCTRVKDLLQFIYSQKSTKSKNR